MTTETNTDLSQRALRAVRARLFPGFWRHQGASGGTRPFYRVRVQDEAELRLAQAAKPRYVRATFRVEGRGGGA